MKQQDKIFFTIGGLAVVIAASATGIFLFRNTDPQSSVQRTPVSSSTTNNAVEAQPETTAVNNSSSTVSESSSIYDDGTYTASSTYMVPRGSNSINTKITVSGGKIATVEVDHNYSDRESGMYIDSFENALQSVVIGQSIDGISPSRIGGATLTTNAFSQTLTTIANEARS